MKTIQQILTHLDVEGYCVIEGVIPSAEVEAVRESVAACLRTEFEATEKRTAAVREKGHRIGGTGVQALPGIINLDQSVAPYLADERIIGVNQSLFGPYHRITNTSAIAIRETIGATGTPTGPSTRPTQPTFRHPMPTPPSPKE